MKIYGPYLRKDGRKHVVIVNDDGSKTTKSWPRVLMVQHLGRTLLPSETVDHIDGDFTNDSLNNLQLLSLTDNAKKQHEDVRESKYITLKCKCCGNSFERRKALDNYERVVRGKDGPFCSKSCVGKIYH